MRLFEFLVFVGGLCLVFTKAESKPDGTFDDFFDDQLADFPAKESIVEDKPGNAAKNDHLYSLKEDTKAKEDPKKDPKEDSKKDPKEYIRTERLHDHLSRQIFLTIGIPTNINSDFFQSCYCFKRRCFVPGMSPGFKGWITVFQSGYVVINNYLYFFWNCSPRPQPFHSFLKPTPSPTRPPFSRFG